ncbi:MAG: four helix bundle protein, partial [Flavobacteriales bacterium]|nr:four helix bundle protein [Flavobacteriales bacterium]
GNLIVDRSFEVALRVGRFSRRLREAGWPDLARQLLRSGTSVGANVHEAQDAESRDDFIHKMKLAAKEANESRFWLKLCKYTEELPHEEGLLDDLYEISSVLSAIIIKSRQNARK